MAKQNERYICQTRAPISLNFPNSFPVSFLNSELCDQNIQAYAFFFSIAEQINHCRLQSQMFTDRYHLG